MNKKPSILVVDDEPTYVKVISTNLIANGYQVFAAYDGQAALDAMLEQEPDLILLDIKLPKLNGLDVCRHIREFSTTPIIFLTGLTKSSDKVTGLNAGADDYITKPISATELLARVQAKLRRVEYTRYPAKLPPLFQYGDLTVNFDRRRVFVCDQEIKLSPNEYKVLVELVSHLGQVVFSDYLLEKIWGPGSEGKNRLVWQVIYRLRHKLERISSVSTYIQTRPGSGYIFESSN